MGPNIVFLHQHRFEEAKLAIKERGPNGEIYWQGNEIRQYPKIPLYPLSDATDRYKSIYIKQEYTE